MPSYYDSLATRYLEEIYSYVNNSYDLETSTYDISNIERDYLTGMNENPFSLFQQYNITDKGLQEKLMTWFKLVKQEDNISGENPYDY